MWMGSTEACEYLGIRLRTLYKRIDIGEITAYRNGRVLRMRREDLDDYLERVRVRPGPRPPVRPRRGAGRRVKVWIGTGDAARLLGVTQYCLYGLIQRGEVPAYRIASVIRLRRADVDQHLRLAAAVVALLTHRPLQPAEHLERLLPVQRRRTR